MWNMAHFAPTAIEWGDIDREMKRYVMKRAIGFYLYVRNINKWYVIKRLEIANGANLQRVKEIDDFNSYMHWWGLLHVYYHVFYYLELE